MLEDVLEAIGEARTIERTIVVSGEPRALELAATAGAEVVPDPDEGGHPGRRWPGSPAPKSTAPAASCSSPATARCSTRASSTAC